MGTINIQSTDLSHKAGLTYTGTSDKTIDVDSLVTKVSSTDNAIARFDGTGGAIQNSSVVIDDSGNVLVTSSTGGLGYGTGAGGTVTQLTSKSTAVTLNKPCGKIIMNNASLASGATVDFTLNNSLITTGDCLVVTNSTWSAYLVVARQVANGSADIYVTNTGASTQGQAVPIQFQIIKGANS